jgi:hypothetical protein
MALYLGHGHSERREEEDCTTIETTVERTFALCRFFDSRLVSYCCEPCSLVSNAVVCALTHADQVARRTRLFEVISSVPYM